MQQLFANAIRKEKHASQFYTELAGKTSNRKLAALFERLSEEEVVHKRLFEKLDIATLERVNSMPLHKLNLVQKTDSLNPEDLKDLTEGLNLAIKREQEAYDDYNILAEHISEGDIKRVLKDIAEQEKRHKLLLVKAKEDLNERN